MGSRVSLALIAMLASIAILVIAAPVAPGAPQGTRLIPSAGTTSIHVTGTGSGAAIAKPELRPGFEEEEADEGGVDVDRPRPGFKNGKFPKNPLDAPTVPSSAVAGSNPELGLGFEGLNHFEQRFANGGNQFSLEPPDQALCVGGGFTVEATNSVIRVFSSSSGGPLTGVMDLNTFFGYPAALDRATGVIGPNVIDPVCLYNAAIQRFVVALTTLHVDEDGGANGKNTMDLAVSNTGSPTGAWTIYHVPVQNDGTDGTPDHGCTLDGDVHGPCFQDYPHIGADANGVYITSNEYDLFGPRFNAAQILAFSNAQLAAHPAAIPVTLVENLEVDGSPGFTVWPANSNAGDYATDKNGTEYFLSTIAGDGSETGNPTGTARRIGLWALTNTASLNTATPTPRITSRLINSQTYVFPPVSDQKVGDIPLGECLNDNTLFDPVAGIGCWFLFFDPPPTWQPEVESSPDSLDTRMQQVWYANGMLWGSNGTAVNVGGELKAGISWYGVSPKINGAGKVEGQVKEQGYLALANNNLTMPAIAMAPNGKGAIAFTVLGENYYPSAGYAIINANGSVGPIHVGAPGLGPADGFTSYKAFVGDPPRTRWGDYGAAVTDGNTIWVASEYIAQTCTLEEYLFEGDAIGWCPDANHPVASRSALANWSTRVSKLTP
jgi:hypothetical protein